MGNHALPTDNYNYDIHMKIKLLGTISIIKIQFEALKL